MPLVAIPVTDDQPGTAERVRRCGAGTVLPVADLTVARLKRHIRQVLTRPSYREAAQRMADAMATIDGAGAATAIIEQIFGAPHVARAFSAHQRWSLAAAMAVREGGRR